MGSLALSVGCRPAPADPNADADAESQSADVHTDASDVPMGPADATTDAGMSAQDVVTPPDRADTPTTGMPIDVDRSDTNLSDDALDAAAPADVVAPDGSAADIDTLLPNLLQNGGFELGETWRRPAGTLSHAWTRTGDAIFESASTFSAVEGQAAQKVWGRYGGSVPNTSEHWLALTDLSEGDTHTLTGRLLTHADDKLSGANQAVLFLRYLDTAGAVLLEKTSAPIDAESPASVWHEATVSADVPAGTVSGTLGLKFTLGDSSDGGSVYLDDVVWTSTGTGAVFGERQLVWHDEFDGDSLDESQWTRLSIAAYTFNAEQQTYTQSTDNADVADGHLVITARQEPGGAITSARLVTAGKAEWTYGRIEARLQVPSGVGTWPAFWMLPTNNLYGGWPASGEIDIMEHVGCELDQLYATVHTGAYNHLLGTQQGGATSRDASASMHLYSVDWAPDKMVFSVDSEVIFTFENDGANNSDTWPFNQDFHVVLNLAIGGSWGGWCGVDLQSLPQTYRVDWVRVYQ